MEQFIGSSNEPPEPVYLPFEWSVKNMSLSMAGRSQQVARGTQAWSNSSGALLGTAAFFVLPSMVSRKEVKRLRAIVTNSTPDMDADSVDGMSTMELVLERNGSYDEAMQLPDKADRASAHVASTRHVLRQRIGAITRPIMQDRITPFVRARYPSLCGKSAARTCTPCHSIIRRYTPGARRTHDLHFDLHAIVTVVVSLSDYGSEHAGGLHIQAAGNQPPRVLRLGRGDALIHESDLLHGVQLPDDEGTRWSWVLWYLDSDTCDARPEEWHKDCADEGDALCQYLLSLRLGGQVRASLWEKHAEIGAAVDVNGAAIDVTAADARLDARDALGLVAAAQAARLAAEGGLGRAMDHYAMLLRSGKGVPKDEVGASLWVRRAINASNEARAHCHLGQMLSEGSAFPTTPQADPQVEALIHFRAAAHGGSRLCHYNVGVYHLHGRGGATRDKELALRWFVRAHTGNAMHAAAAVHAEKGRLEDAEEWLRRAESAGVPGVTSEIARLRAHRAAMPSHAHATRQAHTSRAGVAPGPGMSDERRTTTTPLRRGRGASDRR